MAHRAWLMVPCLVAVLHAPARVPAAAGGVPLPASLPAPRTALNVEPVAALVRHLRDAHPVERLRFAALALDELARRYAEALAVEARDPRPAKDPASRARWRGAARESIAAAHAEAARLALTANVDLFLDPGAVLRFIVAGRTVIVDDPDLGGDASLNGRVAERYCALADCPDVFGPAHATGEGQPRVWTSWSFGAREAAVLETSAGLDFRFRDRTHLTARKRGSLAFIRALERSAGELAWYRDRGVPVEWPSLHVTRGPGGGAVLVVNSAGDYLAFDAEPVALPREPLARWYRARLAGRSFRWVFEGSERFFAPGAGAPSRADG